MFYDLVCYFVFFVTDLLWPGSNAWINPQKIQIIDKTNMYLSVEQVTSLISNKRSQGDDVLMKNYTKLCKLDAELKSKSFTDCYSS